VTRHIDTHDGNNVAASDITGTRRSLQHNSPIWFRNTNDWSSKAVTPVGFAGLARIRVTELMM
jgi:hypothetical protein